MLAHSTTNTFCLRTREKDFAVALGYPTMTEGILHDYDLLVVVCFERCDSLPTSPQDVNLAQICWDVVSVESRQVVHSARMILRDAADIEGEALEKCNISRNGESFSFKEAIKEVSYI